MKGKKTGGRRPGSLNKARGLGKKRERVRRDAVAAIQAAMPRLRLWIASSDAWERDNAAATAKMVDSLMRWVLPAYDKVDPHAEQQAEQVAAEASAQAVTAESILMAFKSMPQPARQHQAAQPAEALEQAQPDGIARLSTAESEHLRHQGVPLEDGSRLIPASPPMPARAEAGALPASAPKRDAIDVQPEPRRFRLEDFDGAGCIQREPPTDPASLPASWRR